LPFSEKISRIYQENSQAKPKNITLVSIDTRQAAKHDQAEFQPATQMDLDSFLTFFQKKIQNLSENLLSEFQKNSNLSIHFFFN
jgi:serine/threonine-protein kinase RIO1